MFKLFIISTGRTGSQAVARWLGIHHEPYRIFPTEQPKLFHKLHERLEEHKDEFYGEANSAWRYKIDELVADQSDATFIHLVRDGRKVVSSYRNKDYYNDQKTTVAQKLILPVEGFEEMPRFEKLCWFWRYWNEEIEKRIPVRIRLEDIGHLFPRRNTGKPHQNWTVNEEETFNRVCGDLMKRYGY